jgi:uncharacterized protein
VAAGEHVSGSPLSVDLPDVDDLSFLEIAVSGGADALVAGNAKHFPRRARSGVRVLTSSEFVELWAKTGASHHLLGAVSPEPRLP